ncbi:hypothetical protein SH2C18_39090 [Clostridium sediminicola]|uniref:hypothetical protein n=1 Tax=Clostridium sediminicola TaxID=3114879 RepID=UPI0031F22E40
MNNFKKLIIPGTIALSVLGASTAFAAGATSTNLWNDISKGVTMEHRGSLKGGFENREDREALRIERQETEGEIIKKAEELIPGVAEKIETVRTEINTAHDGMKEKIDDIKEKVESGEITREELREKLGNKMGKLGHGSKEERAANPWSELESAIESKDKEATQTAVESILEHMNEHLTSINEKLDAL